MVMTTVIDPGTGSESVFFNKSGTAILNQSSSGTSNSIDVGPVAGRVILIATDTQPGGPVQATVNLSSDFLPGDEFWLADAVSWQVIDEHGNILPTNGRSSLISSRLVSCFSSNAFKA